MKKTKVSVPVSDVKVPTPGITVMFKRGGAFRKEKRSHERKMKCRGPLKYDE
jgi:hypothetical protein